MSRQFLTLLLIGVSTPALAQRTTNNAVTASDDAFGRAVGTERIGIYSSEEVRGFNPIEAGNARIEGLYFDQQGMPPSRLIDSSAVRVGYAARGYAFPSPTGIVDLKLEKFEGKRVISADLEVDADFNRNGSIQFKLPLAGERLGISFGQGFRIGRQPQSRFGNFSAQSVLLSWRPAPADEVTAFWSRFSAAKLGASPIIFPATPAVPTQIARKRFLGQPWAQGKNDATNEGIVAKFSLGSLKLDAGLFHSERQDKRSFADLLIGVDVAGTVANRVIVADEGNFQGSTSGEMRLTRIWSGETLRHSLIATLRARDQKREFGGQDRKILGGPQTIFVPGAQSRPVFVFGANDVSAVRQMTVGLGYDVQWKGRGSLSLAAQKSNYRKQVDFANPALANAITRDKPLLVSANGAVNILPGLIAYGGFVQGLEESAVAPDIAINRSEAPPALRTNQKDAGLRYAISPKLSLIVGVFDIKKPYFNVDTTQRFRQLGAVRNRGIEISFAGTLAPGVTVVAGSLFLDPKISGPDVTAGRIGERPVGSFRRRTVANFDWRPTGQEAWSFDLAFEAVGAETANIANTFTGTARETIGVGTRYRFKMGDTKLLMRAQVTNILNDYGWKVSSSGGFTFSLPRTFVLSLAADI